MAPLTLTSTLPLPHTSQPIPRLGFGVYLSTPTICQKSCATALSTGYRHIDSAQYYENESEVGLAVASSNIPRSELFLTTKVLFAGKDVQETYEGVIASVEKMGGKGGYVDLFLIHSPNFGREKTEVMWKAMERAYGEGRCKAIGVSNFGKGHVEGMKEFASVWPPAVNQIELHPWCQQREAVSYCTSQNMIISAYSPIVRNQKADDPTLKAIAAKHNKSTSQVLIRYCLQKGWVPLPKSDTPARIEENADVYGFELDEGDMKELDALDQGSEGAIVQAVENGGW